MRSAAQGPLLEASPAHDTMPALGTAGAAAPAVPTVKFAQRYGSPDRAGVRGGAAEPNLSSLGPPDGPPGASTRAYNRDALPAAVGGGDSVAGELGADPLSFPNITSTAAGSNGGAAASSAESSGRPSNPSTNPSSTAGASANGGQADDGGRLTHTRSLVKQLPSPLACQQRVEYSTLLAWSMYISLHFSGFCPYHDFSEVDVLPKS